MTMMTTTPMTRPTTGTMMTAESRTDASEQPTMPQPTVPTGPTEPTVEQETAARRTVTLQIPVPRRPRVPEELSQRARHTGGELSRSLRGIRGRVVLGYLALVAGALILSLLVVRGVLLVRTDRQIEESLAQEVEELRRLATGIDPATGEPFATDAAAIFDVFLSRNVPADGEVLLTIVDGQPYKETLGAPVDLAADPALVAEWSELTEPVRRDLVVDGVEARTLAVPLLGDDGATVGVFVVIYFPAETLAEVGQAVRIIGGVGLIVLVVAALVALGLARKVLEPVNEMTETAQRINDNDLTARFTASGDDELAALGGAFNEMLDRLEAGFRSQRDVLDDVAHEMRTPITIVRGHLELLDDDPEERVATVELCLDELDRMNRYVDDLLLVASARRPDFLHPVPVDVGELAESLLSKVTAIGARDWRLVDAPRPGSCFIEADEARLTQAVVNLAGNAVQHSEEGSRVDLALRCEGDVVTLSVRDHGVGIDREVRDHMFSRFSRAAGSRAGRPEGTGLGLAIVAAIAEAHGGTVAADDPPGGGARITLTIPTHLDDAPEDP
jgi:signal transduction histidine kinase